MVDGKNLLRMYSVFTIPCSLFIIWMADGGWQMAGKKVDGWWLMVDGKSLLRMIFDIHHSLFLVHYLVGG